MSFDLAKLTIASLQKSLVAKDFSCAELVQAYLQKITKENPKINAYLEVFEEEAVAQAQAVDKKIAAKQKLAALEGVPVAIKDNLLYKNHQASAASKILENYIAPYTATAVAKLRNAGAIILGRTNMDEFAMGSSTENSAFGLTRNPLDTARVPGGSSGGSAAAVAANLGLAALGSDTGGSIRQPASFCGLVGLKPTYGSVSRYGLMAMASSLDQIGPLAGKVSDCRALWEVIRGRDPKDATSYDLRNHKSVFQIKGLRVGLPKEYFVAGLDEVIKEKIMAAAGRLKSQGAKIVEVTLPHTEQALAVYYIIMAAEVSSNLARYDGIRFGFSVALDKSVKTLPEVYNQSRSLGFGREVKRRLILGSFVLSSGYYDAYYKRAALVRRLLTHDFELAWEKVDCLLTPTTPTTAFKIKEKITDPLTMYLSDIYTVSANLAGVPALSLPVGQIDGLPVGAQIMGPVGADQMIFSLAEQIEKNTTV